MFLITLNSIVFKNRNFFLNFAPFCSFLSTCYPFALRTDPISILLRCRFICWLSDASLILALFFCYRHRIWVVINVSFWFFDCFFSSPIKNNFYLPSNLASFDSTSGLLKDMIVFGRFLSLPLSVANYVKNVDEWGRNIMCVSTLLSLLVLY